MSQVVTKSRLMDGLWGDIQKAMERDPVDEHDVVWKNGMWAGFQLRIMEEKMVLQKISDVVGLLKQFGWRARIEVYQGGPVEHNLKARNQRIVINLRPGVDKKKVKDFRGELLKGSKSPIVWEIQPNLKWYQCFFKRRQYEIYL